MMPAYTFPEEKLEAAWLAVLQAQGATDGFASAALGLSDDEVSEPSLAVVCADSEPEVIGDSVTGNWTCQLRIEVRTHAKDSTRAQHAALSAAVRDVAMRDDICVLLNQAGQDIYCQIVTPKACQRAVDGHSRLTTQTVEVYVSASDVTASSSSSSP